MPQHDLIHEHVRFGQDDRIAAILSYPAEGEPALAVLICSPHPNFGGDMENNVITALAERLAVDAITLRFDYRGVGESHIDLPPALSAFDYWENVEETLDYTDALLDTAVAVQELSELSAGRPIVAVGYSFGSIMATLLGVKDSRIIAMVGIAPPLKRFAFAHLADCKKPCLLVSGRSDFVFDPNVSAAVIKSAGPNLTCEQPDADHFFIGQEADLADNVARYVIRSTELKHTAGGDGPK
ncbi:alpha/beta hydrolase [soil metagenome]